MEAATDEEFLSIAFGHDLFRDRTDAAIAPGPTSESFTTLRKLLDGTMKTGALTRWRLASQK